MAKAYEYPGEPVFALELTLAEAQYVETVLVFSSPAKLEYDGVWEALFETLGADRVDREAAISLDDDDERGRVSFERLEAIREAREQ